MAKLLKLRRGSTSEHSGFTGAEGEVTVDTDKETLVVHDGSTAGGHPVAAEDMANVSSASIAGRLGTDSIATTKIAAGALPTDVTVADANISGNLTIESADIVDGAIVNADINASAAIAGTKISPDFGSQNITTSGTISATGNGMTISGSSASLTLTDDGDDPDYRVQNNNGQFRIFDYTNSANRFSINSSGVVDIAGNLDVGNGLDVTGASTYTGPLDINTATNQHIILQGSSEPYIRFREGTTDKAYLQWNPAGYLEFYNQETDESLKIASGVNGLQFHVGGADRTVWHTANDGSGSGLDADLLDGQEGSYYQNAGNLNAGTIPDARFPATLPAVSGANLTGIVSFVSGMIIMYNSATPPSGWYLCNGSNGTPDLRDRFIVGAGNSYSQGATGGSNTATDNVSISGSDTVNISVSVSGTTGGPSGSNQRTAYPGAQASTPNNSHTHSFSGSGSGSDTVNISGSDTVSIDTRSPYYALTFIMKA